MKSTLPHVLDPGFIEILATWITVKCSIILEIKWYFTRHLFGDCRNYLKHETNNKYHGNTWHDIRVVLNNKFMANNWWVFAALWTSNCHIFLEKPVENTCRCGLLVGLNRILLLDMRSVDYSRLIEAKLCTPLDKNHTLISIIFASHNIENLLLYLIFSCVERLKN